MGSYPRTPRGKRFLVVVTDLFTRWVEAFPVSNVWARTITNLLEGEVYSLYGFPKVLLMDNGSQFMGKQWRADCRRWGIAHHTTPTYHPSANPTERRNQDIKAQLRLRLGDDHTKWDVHLPKILYCLRWRVNAVTGHSPAELVQGENLALPGECRIANTATEDWWGEELRPQIEAMREEAKERQAQFLAHKTPTTTHTPVPLTPGQWVYVRQHHLSVGAKNFCAGLAPKWSPPRQILWKTGPSTYAVRTPSGRPAKIHRDDLRLVTTLPDAPNPHDPGLSGNTTRGAGNSSRVQIF
ncbi:uncharacterized protein LOC134536197 [Bacillus rossius redtenbacheri]|uniref:uncharacterized protein LOC134536197 n=1 Tax=Bacillus rossius redtenbacheri TaxID=93214 RepID=UPI002FDE788C